MVNAVQRSTRLDGGVQQRFIYTTAVFAQCTGLTRAQRASVSICKLNQQKRGAEGMQCALATLLSATCDNATVRFTNRVNDYFTKFSKNLLDPKRPKALHDPQGAS